MTIDQKITDISAIKKLLSSPQNILITAHFKPDGDAIGSSLGLFHVLKKMGHDITVMMPSPSPDFLHWLPSQKEIFTFNQNIPAGVERIKKAEIIFCLDYNAFNRTNQMEVYLRDSNAFKILIDHHLDPEDFANFDISKPSASSTCELIYDFVSDLGMEELIDEDAANCLLTGLVTDTGRFKYALNPNVFSITSSLLEKGGDLTRINGEIFDSSTEDRLRLTGFSLSERMVLIPELRAAFIYLSIEDYKRFNFKIGDNEGLVNMPLSIKEVVFSTLISETDDLIKFSFRSKGEFPCNEFAKEFFNGGGHRNASGGRYTGKFEDAIERFKSKLAIYKDHLIA